MQNIKRWRNDRPSTNVQIFLQDSRKVPSSNNHTSYFNFKPTTLPKRESQRWKENACFSVFELPNRARYKDDTGDAELTELLPLAVNGLLFYSEKEDSRFLPNSDKFLPDYMATHSIRQFCLEPHPWEPQCLCFSRQILQYISKKTEQ